MTKILFPLKSRKLPQDYFKPVSEMPHKPSHTHTSTCSHSTLTFQPSFPFTPILSTQPFCPILYVPYHFQPSTSIPHPSHAGPLFNYPLSTSVYKFLSLHWWVEGRGSTWWSLPIDPKINVLPSLLTTTFPSRIHVKFHEESAQRNVQEHRHPNACRISDIFWHLIE